MLTRGMGGLLFYLLTLEAGRRAASLLSPLWAGIVWAITPLMAVLLLWIASPWQLVWRQGPSAALGAMPFFVGLLLAAFSFAAFMLFSSLGQPSAPAAQPYPLWAHHVAAGGSAPLAEEVLFRSRLLTLARGKAPPRTAVWTSALLFAVVHPRWEMWLPALVAGLVLAVVYLRVGLLACVSIHLLHNLLLLPPPPSLPRPLLLLLAPVALVLLWLTTRSMVRR